MDRWRSAGWAGAGIGITLGSWVRSRSGSHRGRAAFIMVWRWLHVLKQRAERLRARREAAGTRLGVELASAD